MAKKTQKKNSFIAKVSLEKIADNLTLPHRAYYDFNSFAGSMQLFDYQEQAVIKAVKLLCQYFDNCAELNGVDYLTSAYLRNCDYPLDNLSVNPASSLFPLLAEYFTVNDNKIDYRQLLNRMSFWMATGSGKTVVMVKLIAILSTLIKDGLIPAKPIMILAPDESILNQIIATVDRYNTYAEHKLTLVDLKQNWEKDNRYAQPDYLANNYTKVYYYKSNNFVADKSEVSGNNDGRNIYYDNYRSPDGWYLFLDEAHRGEKSSSKRKAIFDILAKDGFLFNFSATFTDDIDIISTIFDMNLAKFLQLGYGKKLYISETEIGELATETNQKLITDDNDLEKQKTIAKTVLLLAVQRKNALKIKAIDSSLYHMPLMLVLAGVVNSEDRGLKPFFNYLIQMVKNEWDIIQAKQELIKEIKRTNDDGFANFKFGLGDLQQIQLISDQIEEITTDDLWQYVFGGNRGNIEVITYEKNRNEVAFKLKTATEPFALLVIGDAINWLKHDTSGVFEVVNRSIDSSLFESINSQDNIAMLLGSQMFKEGWDSNRPNIVCYLGIGKNEDNKKYVMQTIGRGIRIEPLRGQRKRFEYCNTESLSVEQVTFIRSLVPVLETEFIFATDSKAINQIWAIVQEQGSKEEWNEKIAQHFKLNKNLPRELILPRYKDSSNLNNQPYRTSESNRQNLSDYLIKLGSDKVLALKHNLNLRAINKLRDSNNISVNNKSKTPLYKPEYLVESIRDHFNRREKVIADFVHLSDQIKHYQHIATTLTNGELEQLEAELKQIMLEDNSIPDEDTLLRQLQSQQITIDQYASQLQLAKLQKNNEISYKIITTIKGIKSLFKHHYYQPILLCNETYQDKFKHVLKVSSEIQFLTELCTYQDYIDNKYQWWYFTKVDETLDKEIGIDYFDQSVGAPRKFYPDFIFWLKDKVSGRLIIKFVDPKGGEHQNNPSDKALGFQRMFAIDSMTEYARGQIEDENYQFDLYFYNKDEAVARHSGEFRSHWCSSLDQIF